MTLTAVEPVHVETPIQPRLEAIQRARQLVALGLTQRSARSARADMTAINAEIDTAFDGLLGFLLDAFPGEPPARDRVSAIFAAGRQIGALDDTRIESLDSDLVPVAVMREICHVHRVRFTPEHVGHWSAFMARYKSAIVG